MKIELKCRYKTRDRKPVRIYNVDPSNYPQVHGAIYDPQKCIWFNYAWLDTGSVYTNRPNHRNDLRLKL